jgi:hypothetical protein
MPATVSFEHTGDIVDSGGGGGGLEEIPTTTTTIAAGPNPKPEAIVRPLRRREPSDDDHRSPEIEDLEAQIIKNLNNLESQDKKESDKKSLKKFAKDVSNLRGCKI